jgi:hypothetical protein
MNNHDDQTTMLEHYLDCTGKKRQFRLQSYAHDRFLEATEILDGEPVGMRFVMRADPRGELPWGELRERIRQRMSERDVAVDPDTGKLEILRSLVRAHIDAVPDAHEDDREGPVLIVDDRRITWRKLGQMLAGLEGFDLRLEILEPTQE